MKLKARKINYKKFKREFEKVKKAQKEILKMKEVDYNELSRTYITI